MERGVHATAWLARQHNYHPGLPARRLRMVEDLVAYRATALAWAALGGGGISLPYLEHEAFGEIDPRFRLYGFMNDQEFIDECRKHGIKVFGVVFSVQGWEFPVELNEAEDRILALNELRGAGTRAWLGLREFTQNRYPKLWAPFETYFPDGLVNSDGEAVTDLLEECCTRDVHGRPCHAEWLECPDREHFCYYMDRNNPVWREYLKAIVRIQIDAGVDGVQFDEPETPLSSIRFGGCFCKDCIKGFRAYLLELPAEERPGELAEVDLAAFHYGDWLLERGHDFLVDKETTPLFWHYLRFQRRAVVETFAEVADYVREYAASKGRRVLVGANFFNFHDTYYAMEPKADLLLTEQRNTGYRQPAWYRYVSAFTRPKPVVVVMNPYGGVVPELVEQLRAGKAYDRYRMALYEAAALGANLSVPYGAWMGSVIEDAFYGPHETSVEIQRFLADHERLYSKRTYAETAVVYSVESAARAVEHDFPLVARNIHFRDEAARRAEHSVVPFWPVVEALSDARQPYDVVFFPDGRLRPDAPGPLDLAQYRTVVLPDCRFLTPEQASSLLSYLDRGGSVLAFGEVGHNLPNGGGRAIADHANTSRREVGARIDPGWLDGGPQLRLDRPVDLAVNVQRVEAGAAVHVIRYDYDPAQDRVPVLPNLTIELRLPGRFDGVSVHSPDGSLEASCASAGDRHRLELRHVPLYGVVLLERAG